MKAFIKQIRPTTMTLHVTLSIFQTIGLTPKSKATLDMHSMTSASAGAPGGPQAKNSEASTLKLRKVKMKRVILRKNLILWIIWRKMRHLISVNFTRQTKQRNPLLIAALTQPYKRWWSYFSYSYSGRR